MHLLVNAISMTSINAGGDRRLDYGVVIDSFVMINEMQRPLR